MSAEEVVSTPQIELVARALQSEPYIEGAVALPYDEIPEKNRAWLVRMAKAAVKAMDEKTAPKLPPGPS